MKRYLSLLLGLLGFVPILAQQSDYYYYYKGERIYLTIDSTRLHVVSEGEFQPQGTARSRTAEYTISNSSKSYVYNNVVPLQKQRSVIPDIYFSTIDIPEGLTASQYDDLAAKVKAENNVWQVLPSFTSNGNPLNISNNFYVRLKHVEDFTKLQQLATQYRIEIIGNNEFMPLWYTLSCNSQSSMNSIEAANHFYLLDLFECCEPEILIYKRLSSVDDIPNDKYYGEQWGLNNEKNLGTDINVEDAWKETKGEGVIVAIVDDGVDTGHRDLWDNCHSLESYDATTGTSPSNRYGDHGTNCAGIVGAVQNNGRGISGVAPNAQLISISLDFYNGVSMQQLTNGLKWACKKGAHVMSCSWGYDLPCTLLSNAIDSISRYGRSGKGCVLVFSTGNRGGKDTARVVRFPANSIPRVLAVGASKSCGIRVGDRDSCCMDDFISWESCYGEELDVVAPGFSIVTTTPEISHWSGYIHDFWGTSAACPHVAGVVALMLSVNPDMTAEEVDFIIGRTAHKTRTDIYSYQKDTLHTNGTWNNKVGYGLVDATAAVKMAKEAKETTYVRNLVLNADTFKYFRDTFVEVENVTVRPDGQLHIDTERRALLKSSVRIKKGAYSTIYNVPLQ